MSSAVWKTFIKNADSLLTPHEQTRAGFVALALEKNERGTPYIEEAKSLKIEASKAKTAAGLLNMKDIMPALVTASGVSEKANGYLTERDKIEAVKGLIDKFLEPAGISFVEELVYRFLLTRGDSLGGSMRNLAGKLGEKKFIRALISSLSIRGHKIVWRDRRTNKWIEDNEHSPDIEVNLNAVSWNFKGRPRTLILNAVIPAVKKNVDLSLLKCGMENFESKTKEKETISSEENFIALGELKGGIDPAGADEHWKTANTALSRIRKAFSKKKLKPFTFFIGAAIEKDMAGEIFRQLKSGELTCAGNLTIDKHIVTSCGWLIRL